ncbi:M48 family metallopeptidase [Bacillaceae bacterium]
MKRFFFFYLFAFLAYALAIAFYLLQPDITSLPPAYEGGPADPRTFMSPEQIAQATMFSRLKDLVFFIGTPYEWGILLFFLIWGAGSRLRHLAVRVSRFSLLQVFFYVAAVYFVLAALRLPLQYYLFRLRHAYGLSHQPLADWLIQLAKQFLVQAVIAVPLVWLFYRVMGKSGRRWWVRFWLLSIPLIFFFLFIQPVVLDPFFHDFRPLREGPLKEEILRLARVADIPAKQVFEVNMSRETEAINAYVTGIGPTARIVLWDTTLQKLRKDEILFVMAHEMGHYVLRHTLLLTLGTIAGTFFLLWTLNRALRWSVAKWGKRLGVLAAHDLSSFPLILLLVSVLTFAFSPIANGISRHYERAADEYAMEMIRDKDTAVRTFQRLTIESLAEANPPALVKFFRYGHPTLAERIHYVANWEEAK